MYKCEICGKKIKTAYIIKDGAAHKKACYNCHKESKGGLRNYKEDRPVIELDVLFDGVIYKDIDFTLDNRKGRTEVLLNRRFMRKACVMINPAKVFVLTTKPEEKQ